MRQHLSGIQGPPGPPGASVSVEDVASRVIAYIQRKSLLKSHVTPQKNLFKAFMVFFIHYFRINLQKILGKSGFYKVLCI